MLEVFFAYPAARLHLHSEQFTVRIGHDKVDFSLVLVAVVTYLIPASAAVGNCTKFVIYPAFDDFPGKVAV